MTVAKTAAKVVENQKELLASAALLEAGRIANNKVSDLVAERLPAPFGALAGTPMGQLLVANIIAMAAEQFRPDSELLKRMTNGMVVASYTSLLQSFNIEELLDTLISDKGLTKGLVG